MQKKSLITNSLVKVFIMMCCLVTPVTADVISDSTKGQKTLSKFLENLARYITWPEQSFSDASTPYKYCLLGDTNISNPLQEKLATKKVKKRGFEVIELGINEIEKSKSCHLVFISVNQVADAKPAIDALAGLPILTTGEIDKFANYGGMIGFYGKGSKIGLQINKKRLDIGQLKASSKLYRASTI